MPSGTVSVDEADKLMAEAAGEDGASVQPVNEEQSVESGSEVAQEETTADSEAADPYADADADKLKEVLKQRDAELSKTRKSYTELRSLADKHYNQQKSEIAELRGQYKALTEHLSRPAPKDRSAMEKEQSEFDEKWAAEIAAEPGKGTIAFFRGMANELKDTVLSSIKQELGGLNGKIREVNPLYKEHRETINELKEQGLDDDMALKVVSALSKKLSPKQSVAQPGVPVAPGRTGGVVRKQSSPMGLKLDLEPYEVRVMKNSGLTDKDIEEIRKDLAKEVANMEG